MKRTATAATVLLLAGCAGQVSYVRPSSSIAPGANMASIAKSRDAVWATAVPELGKRFFVINNLDKASGFINISYSGDPEKYVDCGRVTSYVKNARGERTYDFAGSKAQQSYEVMNPGAGLFFIDRRMSLEGRVNLVFEEVSPTETRVTANTRYVVSRQRTVRAAANNIPQSMNDNISFNTGSSATFAGASDQAAECTSTGALEREILSAFR
jgi:hypothetical protein